MLINASRISDPLQAPITIRTICFLLAAPWLMIPTEINVAAVAAAAIAAAVAVAAAVEVAVANVAKIAVAAAT